MTQFPADIVRLQNAATATGNGNTINTNGYAAVAFQVTGTFVSTITFEGTLDGATWVSLQAFPVAGGAGVTTATAAGTWIASCAGLTQARARNTWTSGTSITVLAMAIPDTAVINGGSFSADTELPAAAALADTTANPTTPLIGAAAEVFNGTTWDRLRGTTRGLWAEGNVASGATDSGNPLKVGGVYNTAAPTLTNGQRGDTQLDVNANVKVIAQAGSAIIGKTATTGKVTTTGDTEIAADTVGADTVSNTANRLAVSSWASIFNGTTWDRLRSGDVTADAAGNTGYPGVIGFMSDGAARRRLFSESAQTDANTGANLLSVGLSLFNGTTWDRLRSGAQSNVAAATGYLADLLVGQYNATVPTVTDTRFNNLQTDVNAQLRVAATANITTIKTSITRPADSAAYAANDCFANSTSAPTAGGYTFTSAARVSGGTGTITGATITMSGAEAFQGEIWIFDGTNVLTAVNDNAAFTVPDADVLTLIPGGIIPFNTTDTTAVNSVSYVNNLSIDYTCVGSANLKFLVKVMAAFTPASASVLGIQLSVRN